MTPRIPTRMTRTITTRTTCTSEHSSAPCEVFLVFITCHTTLAQVVLESVIFVLFLFSFLMHSDLHTDLDNLNTVQINLRNSAKGSNDACDVTVSLTGYEPNDTVSNEIFDSQGPFSYVTPSSDQDMDDFTLGKLLTEAHREYADYRSPEGVFVSPSSMSVTSDRTGKPVEKSNIDQFIFLVSETRTVLTISFLQSPKLKKWSIERGNPWERAVPVHRLGLCLMSKEKRLSQSVARKFLITNSKQLEQNKNAKFYKKNYGSSKWIFVKFINKILLRWRNYENSRVLFSIRSQDGSSSRTRQNTIMELSGRLQELQNEVNCMNDSQDFQDAESVRSGNSHATNQPMLFPKHPILEGMLGLSFGSPRRKEWPPDIWDTPGKSGNVFANPHACSSASYPQELHQWKSSTEEPLHSSTVEKSERPGQNQDLRCQSGPSAKDSVIFSEGDFSKNYGADQQRLQISDLHFDKFPTPATFACWKIRFKTEVCTCSQFPYGNDAMDGQGDGVPKAGP